MQIECKKDENPDAKKQYSEIKWIYIIRTIFANGFFCIVLIFVENYTFWFKDFWKKANFKAKK